MPCSKSTHVRVAYSFSCFFFFFTLLLRVVALVNQEGKSPFSSYYYVHYVKLLLFPPGHTLLRPPRSNAVDEFY